MPAQEREARKNYIGIVTDRSEEQRAVESLPKSDRLVNDYLLGLIAAVVLVTSAKVEKTSAGRTAAPALEAVAD